MQRLVMIGVLIGMMLGFVLSNEAFAKESLVNQSLTIQESTVTRLKNGLTVLVLRDTRFPLVSTRLYVHAGSAYEDEDLAGISHMLEHMVFKGTEHRPKGELSREVEAVGGYINAATSYDYTVYLTDLPARHWKLGLDVVRDMALNASLDSTELEAEQQVVLSELDMRMKDRPQGQLFEKLLTETLRGTPYDRPVIGFPESVRNLTTQDLRNYIDKYYQPHNMLLVVVGDIQPTEVLSEAEKLFETQNKKGIDLPQLAQYDAKKLPLDTNGKLRLKPSVVIQPGPWNKVYLAAAFPVPGYTDYNSTSLDVLAWLLGGDRTSLLYRTFKYEQQLVDSISVANVGFERLGLFMISAEMDAEKVAPFWESLLRMFATLDPSQFTSEEIARAKINLEDDLHRSRETLPELASQIGQLQFSFGSIGEAQAKENALAAIRNVNSESIKEVFHTWIDPHRLSVVILHPEKTMMPDIPSMNQKNWPIHFDTKVQPSTTQGDTETIKLGNNSTLVLIPDKTMPYISAKLTYSGGESLLKAEQQGLATLTASVLTRGTSKLSAQEIQAFLSDRAAGLNASSSRTSFSLSFTSPSRFHTDLLALLHDIIESPAFAQDETDRGIKDQLASIQKLGDQPLAYVLRRKIPPLLFPDSIFGYLQLGKPEVVQNFKPDMLKTFWENQKSRPFVLAISGDFDREKMLAFAKSLPASTHAKIDPASPEWGKEKKLEVKMPGRNQAHLLLIFKIVSDTDPSAPAFDLMGEVLGGMGGPLFRELRDKQGLGYTVTAFSQMSRKNGIMVFYIGTTPDKMDKAESGFKSILARLSKTPLDQDELERGKNQLEGNYYRAMQSLGSRAGEAASLTIDDRPLSFSRDQIEKARKVTGQQIQELAKKYLTFADAYVIKVLP